VADKASGQPVRLLTCNTQQGHADARLAALIEREQPDVVCLQEWPSKRPVSTVLAENWHIARSGQLVVASRWPIAASQPLLSPTSEWRTIGLACELKTKSGPIWLFNLHLLTPREGLQAVLSRGLAGLPELEEVTRRRRLDGEAAGAWIASYPGPQLVAGDFNLVPESTIYRREFGHLQNAFSTAGFGWGGTKFTRIHSVRIDHILADEAWQCRTCRVGPNIGSDHRPVIATHCRISK
jgi:endonuclease/exonuclease/phosphatase (EEP) superfamily protein YafD